MILDPNAWKEWPGIDFDGPTTLKDLQDLRSGVIKDLDQQTEILVNLYRDGAPSTAGYAAVPLLLEPGVDIPPYLAWWMCTTAGLILTAVNQEGRPPVPDRLATFVDETAKRKVIQRMLEAAALAQLGAAEILDTFRIIIVLLGRRDLEETLRRLVLRECGAWHDDISPPS